MWQRFLKAASFVEERVDALKQALLSDDDSPVTILPYLGYGTRRRLWLRGRVLANHEVRPPRDEDSIWRNLVNVYHRFDSDEVPHAELTATFGQQQQRVTADEEGFFRVEFQLDEPLPVEPRWHPVDLHYDDGAQQARAQGRALVPPPDARTGIISDLDDTVIRTDVTNWLKLVRNTFFRNAHTRLPFHGVGQFYSALQAGTAPGCFNPIFYVSNSPYNLYDLMVDFFRVRGIPEGPVFLRDMGLTEQHLIATETHKRRTIDHLLQVYPDWPFILIGDSGEHDPDIYAQVVQDYPDRIAAIYIRDVRPHKSGTRRDRRVQQLAQQTQEAGVDMLLIPDTSAAARHAAEHGFIRPEALPQIEAGAQADAGQRAPHT